MLLLIQSFLLLIIVCIQYLSFAHASGGEESKTKRHPLDQSLPDCSDDDNVKATSTPLINKSDKKGILCPMVKDEEGFLSEWVAW